MKIHQLFKQAMDRYGIEGKQLAALAGISTNHLSQFRSGNKWVSPEVFAALLEGMEQLAPGSRLYFCQLLANQPVAVKKTSIVELIDSANDDEMDEILLAIGRKWKKLRQSPSNCNNYQQEINSAIAV
ncbi:helix-turn-helix transcriptional regulator [Anabaena sp. 4-3]|uniref:helix-turn-helix domain-containing protein n=1 Tax=Anabaena sp. 4-3 TaxID=1811979 RepID=UPI0008364C4C|nr:helix-turn-helix transcriptional regulator [Anabaena sp. 4-3]